MSAVRPSLLAPFGSRPTSNRRRTGTQPMPPAAVSDVPPKFLAIFR
jgi:hypothetical protein